MANVSTHTISVLCVDDNELGLQIRQAMLQTFGFVVHLATSGVVALQLMQHTHIDVVVLDYHMPDMNGAELSQRIKQDHPGTPIIMLTGYPYDVPPATLQLVDATLVKGESPEKLLETLLRVTGSSFKRPPMSQKEMTDRNVDHIQAVTKYLKTQRHRKH